MSKSSKGGGHSGLSGTKVPEAGVSAAPTPPLPVLRLLFLLLAGISVLTGLNAALVRLGALAPLPNLTLGSVHGLLMIYGFLGTAICLERAVALQSDDRRPWAYIAPLACGMGGVATVVLSLNPPVREAISAFPLPRFLSAHLPGFIPDRMMPGFLLTIAMATLTGIYVYVWRRRQASDAVLIQLLGAVIGLGGIVLWWRGIDTARAVPWWLAFLIVTIVGERVELARLAFLGRTPRRITGEVCALLIALTVSLFVPILGYPVMGIVLGVIAADTAWHDVARGTIRLQGLPRLAGVCMLTGYAWLSVPALMWVAAPPTFDGYGYDAVIHAVTLGFVVSMLLAHAPVIIPAVIRRPLPFHPIMWLPFALIQASLTLRLLAGARQAPWPWRLGGTLGVAGMLVFIIATATLTVRAARAQGASNPAAASSKPATASNTANEDTP